MSADPVATDIESSRRARKGTGERTKDRLLLMLKTRGELTTRVLADALQISVPAVRQHLQSLGEKVEAHAESGNVGRPAQKWRLTPEASNSFPDTHSELTVKLLESIAATLGAGALERVIEDRYRRSLEHYQTRLENLSSLSGRLRRLVQLRSDEGYMAQVSRDGNGWLLVENHCPICAAATACQGFCRNELALFEQVLGQGVQVERVEYLLDGGQRCAYRIHAGESAPGGSA